MATWPVTLPSLAVGADLSQQDGVIRSPMDAGPSKVRRRFTSTVRYLSGTMVLTSAQKAALDTFFNTTVAGGALAFEYDDPTNGFAGVAARFMAPPTFQLTVGGASGVEYYTATISLELLP